MGIQPGLALRPQDVLVLLKLISWSEKNWRQLDLAMHLGLSQAEIANSLERLKKAGLIEAEKKRPYHLATLEFLLHAVKYILPAHAGGYSRGVPTGRSALPLSEALVVREELGLVWPDEEGTVRGLAVEPLYPSAPAAARRDPLLHELLSLVDALRLGQAREQKLAEQELRKRILKKEPGKKRHEEVKKHPND